jgi:predicted transcriptional regulator
MAESEGPMRKVQVRLPDELIEALADEALAQDRSVSYVVRKALEVHFGKRPARRTAGLVSKEEARTALCSHVNIVKRQAESGGIVKECSDCGTRILR